MRFLLIMIDFFVWLVVFRLFDVVDNSEVKRVTRFALMFTFLFSTLEERNSILLALLL